jgi:hypothetical protein
VRLFVADDATGEWTELTRGSGPAVRIAAADLARARRARAQLKADDDVAVILDVAVAVGPDFRAAQRDVEAVAGVRYAGTVIGLAGLIADIEAAGVADGVTLVPASKQLDLRAVGADVLDLLAARPHRRAS